MMKKKWVICLFTLFLLIPCFQTEAQAQVRDYICYEEEAEDDSDFITEAIKSLDENTAAQEADKDYMKNFYNSSLTASTESLNLFKPSTIITMFLNLLTYFLEIIALCFTLFVMLIYNFSSTTFISGVVGTIISNIEKVMFDWSNPNSWIIKVLVISALLSVMYQLIKNFTKFRGYKQIIQIVMATALSTSLIVFIGQNGRKIVGAVENKTKEMVVETFVFDGQSGNMEINTKENIFNILQKQPFMLRHFGVSSVEKLAERSDQKLDVAAKRVKELLDDPSQDNAEKEYDEYDNNSISHDVGSAMFILFISLIELVHRFLMSLIISILCIVAGAVKLVKELLLWLSIYQLIWWLIKRSNSAQQWFSDRVIWSITAIAADVLFSSALYFLMQACNVISEIHPLLMIGFDVALFVIVTFLIKNMGTIFAKIKDNGGAVLQAVLTGSPADVYHQLNKQKYSDSKDGDLSNDTGDTSDTNDADTDEQLSDTDEVYDESNEDLSDNERDSDTGTDDYLNESDTAADDAGGDVNNDTADDTPSEAVSNDGQENLPSEHGSDEIENTQDDKTADDTDAEKNDDLSDSVNASLADIESDSTDESGDDAQTAPIEKVESEQSSEMKDEDLHDIEDDDPLYDTESPSDEQAADPKTEEPYDDYSANDNVDESTEDHSSSAAAERNESVDDFENEGSEPTEIDSSEAEQDDEMDA